jgi:hypothetical protein
MIRTIFKTTNISLYLIDNKLINKYEINKLIGVNISFVLGRIFKNISKYLSKKSP